MAGGTPRYGWRDNVTKFVILAQLLISTMMGGSAFAAEPDLQLQLEARYAAMKAAMRLECDIRTAQP